MDDVERELRAAIRAKTREKEQAAARLAEAATAAAAATTCFLAPVVAFFEFARREPREVLEARYRHELNAEPPPRATHAWLVTRLAYARQLLAYRAAGRAVPSYLERRAWAQAWSWPGPRDLAADPRADDPTEELLLDPAARVVADVNPFARGDAWTAFQVVVEAGPRGRDYVELRGLLERLEVANVEARTRAFFTEHVRAGRARIIFSDPDESRNPTPVGPV